MASEAPTPLVEQIRHRLREDNFLSFVELGRLPGFRGRHDLHLGPPEFNLVLWVEVSQAAIDAINELISRDEAHFQPASEWTYLLDGGGLTLPPVKRAVAYRRPHWFRVVLAHGPEPKPAPKKIARRRHTATALVPTKAQASTRRRSPR
jgi:hypothetical protein